MSIYDALAPTHSSVSLHICFHLQIAKDIFNECKSIQFIFLNAFVSFTHLCDFLLSVPPGPEPQSWAWMMKVYSFCSSQSTRPRALSWPSPDVPFSTTASNGVSGSWMLNAQISPRRQRQGRRTGGKKRRDKVSVNHRCNPGGEWMVCVCACVHIR